MSVPARLRIKGKVCYAPGPWGTDRGVSNALVRIVDQDVGGQQSIWEGRTDASGSFAGETAEWQGKIGVPVWVWDDKGSVWPPRPPRGHWETRQEWDPSDIPLFTARISKSGQPNVTLPFLSVGDGSESPPLITPWISTDVLPVSKPGVEINGVRYNNPEAAVRAMMDLIERRAPIEFVLTDLAQPVEQLYQALASDATRRKLLGPQFEMYKAVEIPVVVWVLLACVAVILAFAVLTFVSAMAYAIVVAVDRGYLPIETSIEFETLLAKLRAKLVIGKRDEDDDTKKALVVEPALTSGTLAVLADLQPASGKSTTAVPGASETGYIREEPTRGTLRRLAGSAEPIGETVRVPDTTVAVKHPVDLGALSSSVSERVTRSVQASLGLDDLPEDVKSMIRSTSEEMTHASVKQAVQRQAFQTSRAILAEKGDLKQQLAARMASARDGMAAIAQSEEMQSILRENARMLFAKLTALKQAGFVDEQAFSLILAEVSSRRST